MTPATNVATHLRRMARDDPHRFAVVCPHSRDRAGRVSYTHLTFSQLNEYSDVLARGLEEYGISRGTRTVLMVPPSLDFFALVFALFKIGAVLVIIDPGMGTANLKRCIANAKPRAFIGTPKAQAARALFGWGKQSIECTVTVGGYAVAGIDLASIESLGHRSSRSVERYPAPDTEMDETAAILFTSGSTGIPKGAVYTHGIFAHQVELLRRLFAIQPGEIDLCTFPLFALYAPAWGVTAVIADMDATRPGKVNPLRIIEAVRNFGVTHFFGSPALLDRVSRYGAGRGIILPSIRRAVSAGAPVSADILARFSRMVQPGTPIFTPYGATEALPVCALTSDVILNETRALTEAGKGVCVGPPVDGITVHIIAISDEPIECWSNDLVLPANTIGEIVVRGPIVTRQYYNLPTVTAAAKIIDPAMSDCYHRMGDVGYLDEQGRLWFCGRKTQRVVLEQTTLFTIPCESVFNRHPDVNRTALVGVRRAGKVQPVLCVELERNVATRERGRIKEELLQLGSQYVHTREIKAILFHPSFPVDIRHNAKIFRERLAVWAAKQVASK